MVKNTDVTDDSFVHELYVRKRSKIDLELADGSLKEAFTSMYRADIQQDIGTHALIFSSPLHEVRFRPKSPNATAAEEFDSSMRRRLRHLNTRQYKPARWIQIERPVTEDRTQFHLNTHLDAQTREQLRAGVKHGLNMADFGRRALAMTLTIFDSDIVVAKEARRDASRRIYEALWANDAYEEAEPNPLVIASEQHNVFHHIDWTSRIG